MAACGSRATKKLPIVGFVGANATTWSPWTNAFVQRLHELGWIEGDTVAIEYHWNEGQPERIAEIAAEFIRLKVDVIVTNAFAAPTLRQATTAIPIVFAYRSSQSAPASSRVWRDRTATLPGNRSSLSNLRASGSHSCARLFLICVGWQFCLMLASLKAWRKRMRSRLQRIRLASKSYRSKSGVRKMLPPPLRR